MKLISTHWYLKLYLANHVNICAVNMKAGSFCAYINKQQAFIRNVQNFEVSKSMAKTLTRRRYFRLSLYVVKWWVYREFHILFKLELFNGQVMPWSNKKPNAFIQIHGFFFMQNFTSTGQILMIIWIKRFTKLLACWSGQFRELTSIETLFSILGSWVV